jgi:hypothetical protein
MPTTLTLKNIPDNVYARLKFSAQVHKGILSVAESCDKRDESSRVAPLPYQSELRQAKPHENTASKPNNGQDSSWGGQPHYWFCWLLENHKLSEIARTCP